MPGQDQYVALPDNSYVHIPSDASDDDLKALRTKLGGMQSSGPDDLTKQTQAAAKAAGASTAPESTPKTPVKEMSKWGALTPPGWQADPVTFDPHHPERSEMLGAPVAPMGAAMSIPRAVGGLVGGYTGAKAGEMVSNNPWVRDAGAVIGGMFGEGLGVQGESTYPAIKRATYEPPEKTSMGPLGKINWNRPPQTEFPSAGTGAPLPSTSDFYENRADSAQFKDMAKTANKPPAPEPIVQSLSEGPTAHQHAAARAAAREDAANAIVNRPGWTAKLPVRVSEGAPSVESPATDEEMPATANSGRRPTNTEAFLTDLVKKPIWTPEDMADARNAFGPDGAMRPGEGQTQYRARLMGMIRSSRAAQGMTDIESYPAPKGRR